MCGHDTGSSLWVDTNGQVKRLDQGQNKQPMSKEKLRQTYRKPE